MSRSWTVERVGAHRVMVVVAVLLIALLGSSPTQSVVGIENSASLTTGTWGEWADLPGDAQAASAPSSLGGGWMTHLFVRGPNGTVRQNTYSWTSHGWTGWADLPGDALARSAPATVSYGGWLLFVRGPRNGIYHRSIPG